MSKKYKGELGINEKSRKQERKEDWILLSFMLVVTLVIIGLGLLLFDVF